MINYFWFFMAALFEIAGCYTFWLWMRLDKSPLWIIPGVFSLLAFALILTRVELAFAGRSYAAYGAIYILSSLLWMVLIERGRPLMTDFVGGFVCLIGGGIILYGARHVNL